MQVLITNEHLFISNTPEELTLTRIPEFATQDLSSTIASFGHSAS